MMSYEDDVIGLSVYMEPLLSLFLLVNDVSVNTSVDTDEIRSKTHHQTFIKITEMNSSAVSESVTFTTVVIMEALERLYFNSVYPFHSLHRGAVFQSRPLV